MKPATQPPSEQRPNVTLMPDQVLPRCSYHSPRGNHCHSRVAYPTARLCSKHLRTRNYRHPDPTLASELLGDLTEFQSAAEVNQFLSRMLLLLAQDRIPPRRGAVMAYTCNLLLRSLRAMDLESAADRELTGDQALVWDSGIPRPKREDFEPAPTAPGAAAQSTPQPS